MFKIIRASMFVLLLACAGQAGEIQNGSPQSVPQPTPQPMTIPAQEEPVTPEAEADLTFGLSDTLTKAALSVLDNVLALL
ncbi:MAG: hypothetical protein ABW250_12110 [Pyrinomonadaceae bacterium]